MGSFAVINSNNGIVYGKIYEALVYGLDAMNENVKRVCDSISFFLSMCTHTSTFEHACMLYVSHVQCVHINVISNEL